MKSVILAAAALLAAAVPANAALVADFQLNGTLVDALGNFTLTNNGGTLGATGITFAANAGPSIAGFSNTGVYSIVMGFSFDDLDGYRKILDFKDRTSDAGLYNLLSSLNFYPVDTTVPGQFETGVVKKVVMTRDAAKNVVAYVEGEPGLAFVDASDQATITSVLRFFQDDFAFGPFESSAGFVDYIQLHDVALTGDQVVDLNNPVPEPASWVMLIAGFGLVGAAMRRRAATAATA